MKLPLPTDTFATPLLPHEDERQLAATAEMIVQRTIAQYYEHLAVHEGVVDKARWKKIKRRDNLCVYRERHDNLIDLRLSGSSPSAAAPDDSNLPTSILVTGLVPSILDDIMYGMLNTTTEEMQLKAAYIEDNIADSRLLATIVTPSEKEPYRDLSLKWMIRTPRLPAGAFINTRDMLYVESTGIAKTPSGERLGYRRVHSVAVDGVHELTEYQILRLDLTVCTFFRQKSHQCIEVYGRGLVDPSGGILSSIFVSTLTEVALTLFNLVHCAEMKKLTRIVNSRAAAQSSTTSKLSEPQSLETTICALCEKSLKSVLLFAMSSEKRCCVCDEHICSRCCVLKTIYAPTEQAEKQLTATSMTVCTRCMHSVASASSHAFAVIDALSVNDKHDENYYEMMQLTC